MRERTIQSNLNLIRTIIECIEDDEQAELINLDQLKSNVRVDPGYQVGVLQTPGFQPVFCKWINLLYHSYSAVVQVNGKRSSTYPLSMLVRQGCPL